MPGVIFFLFLPKMELQKTLRKARGCVKYFQPWSPDGKYISYYSDLTGEYELYLLENKKGARPKAGDLQFISLEIPAALVA